MPGEKEKKEFVKRNSGRKKKGKTKESKKVRAENKILASPQSK